MDVDAQQDVLTSQCRHRTIISTTSRLLLNNQVVIHRTNGTAAEDSSAKRIPRKNSAPSSSSAPRTPRSTPLRTCKRPMTLHLDASPDRLSRVYKKAFYLTCLWRTRCSLVLRMNGTRRLGCSTGCSMLMPEHLSCQQDSSTIRPPGCLLIPTHGL